MLPSLLRWKKYGKTPQGKENCFMTQERKALRRLVRGALIAAIYAVLCAALAPISYGEVQFRISEALTILPLVLRAFFLAIRTSSFFSLIIAVSVTKSNLSAVLREKDPAPSPVP